MCKSKNMSLRDTVEELTEICMDMRRKLESHDRKEQDRLILRHIKAFADKDLRITDFQAGENYRVMSCNEDRTETEKQNVKYIRGVNIAKSTRPINPIDKGNRSLTEEETREYLELLELEKVLDKELLDLRNQEKKFRSTEETMNLLHKYNDIKDATQAVMGAIAIANRTTVKSLYKHYGLEWINVSKGLSVYRDLAGKIVLLDFFTYCCINCMHILPDLEALEKQFSVTDGLVVIGVHSAKFSNERDSKKVLSAVQRHNIKHPVINDPTLSVWRDLGISCWPTMVMIGPKGQPLAVFVGEGHRKELALYVNIALTYFKSLNQISNKDLPLQLAKHLLPTVGKGTLLFPSKLVVFQSEQGEKLVISDTGNNRILVSDVTGNLEHVIGGFNPGFQDGDFKTVKFNAPQGVCILGTFIYVADNENHSIRKIDLTKRIVTTVAGTGVQGHDYVGGKIGRDQAVSSPWDVAIYNYENNEKIVPVLLIAMAGTHQIWALFLEDTVWWKSKEYKAGACVAIVGSGREENRNNSYPHAAGLAQPSGLIVAQKDKVAYFANSESSSIRSIDLKNGRVFAVCGANRNPADLHDYGDCDGVLYAAKLQHPLGLTWHPQENVIYVADTYNHKIKKVDAATGNCKTVFGGGKPSENFSFDEPSGLAISSNDQSDLLYVTDTNNHAIKVIDIKNKTISTLNLKAPENDIDDNSSENVYLFDATINKKGGELNITFDVSFANSDLKLNTEAPQKWTIKDSSASTWVTTARTGDLTSPISIKFPEGNGMHKVHVTLDIVVCKTTECIPKKLSITYSIYAKASASDVVTEHKKLVVK